MGNSYVKIKKTEWTISFIYWKDNQYNKVIISAHPDNTFNHSLVVNRACYRSYGDWYTFDGNVNRLHNTITTFQPTERNLTFLPDLLVTHCDVVPYSTLWESVKSWTISIVNNIKNIGSSGLQILGLVGAVKTACDALDWVTS